MLTDEIYRLLTMPCYLKNSYLITMYHEGILTARRRIPLIRGQSQVHVDEQMTAG